MVQSIRARLAATVVAMVVIVSLLPATASAAGGSTDDTEPTTTTATLNWPPAVTPGADFQILGSTVRTADGGQAVGTFSLLDVTSGPAVEVGTFPGCSGNYPPGTCKALFTVTGRSAGTYQFQVHFIGTSPSESSDSNVLEVVVGQIAPTVWISPDVNPVQAHHSVWLSAGFYGAAWLAQPTDGTLVVRDLATNTIIATADPGSTGVGVAVVPSVAGDHSYRAEWTGDATYTAGTATVVLHVVADVVEATGVGVSSSTFYPVVDGYYDTVAIRGTRAEPISVAITIRNSAGSIVRKASVPLGSGAYSWAWNGKNTSGTLLPAGTYKVSQVLKDAAGTTKTVTSSVVLSRKKLYWYTTDLYKTASQYQKTTGSWRAWLFTMPSAASYRSLRLYVYGKVTSFGYIGDFGAQDRRSCSWATISPNCVSHHGQLSPTLGWVSTPLNATYDRSGRYVRGYVWAEYGGLAVGKLRLHLQYGILK